jgi:hypothetical protein
VLIVLGMHKSGTTLIAETLHRSGISMVDDKELIGLYGSGFTAKRASTRALNKTVLGMHGRHSLSMANVLAPSNLEQMHVRSARRLIKALSAINAKPTRPQSPAWGFKDPRTLLSFSALWEPLLRSPCLLGIVRNPAAVFAHYKRSRFSRESRLLWQSLIVWTRYNRELLEIKQRHPNLLLLDYDAFLNSNTGLQALACHLGLPLSDCRRPELQRSQPRRSAPYQFARKIAWQRLGEDPETLYASLQRLAVP